MSEPELEARLYAALDDPNPFESEKRIKETVADALLSLDPSASLDVTRYFNHSYAPDMVLSWGKKDSRQVFLRFTDDVPALNDDIRRLESLDPLVFGLSTPRPEALAESHIDDVAREADALFAAPQAVDVLSTPEHSTPTYRMLRNSLAQGGRGSLATTNEATDLAKTVNDGFDAASDGVVTGTRLALDAIGRFFRPTQATRLTRVMQAVWERTSRADLFPGEAQVTGRLNDLSLAYLLQYMDTDDGAFWSGVGRTLDLDQVLALSGVAHLPNFQYLLNSNLDVIRARAVLVLDMALLDGKEPELFVWSIQPKTATAAPAVSLRGPGFQALATSKKEDLLARLASAAHAGIDIDTFIARATAANLSAVEVTVGGMRVQVSTSGGQFDQAVLANATGSLHSPLVDRALVSTPSGRATVDFGQMTGTARTHAEPLMADILAASVTLLADLQPDERSGVLGFLAHAAPDAATGEDTLPLDEAGQPSDKR